MERLRAALRQTLQQEGMRGLPYLMRKAGYKLVLCRQTLQQESSLRQQSDARYHQWASAQQPSAETRSAHRSRCFSHKLSILIPTYNTRPALLRALADSLLAQTCPRWEACLYDGCSTQQETQDMLHQLAEEDSRFHVIWGTKNLNISGNTNQAAQLATGDWIALCDHDDLLAPEAVYHVLAAAEEGADFVYTDEDKCSEDGLRFFEPHCKPDFSPEALRSSNYICHWMAMERALFDRVGGLRSVCDGSQDHDLALRATEQARQIVHIPRILYHWRMINTSFSHQALERCVKASVLAVTEQVQRLHLDATVHMEQLQPRVVYHLPEGIRITLVIWAQEEGTERWLRKLERRTRIPVDEVMVVRHAPIQCSFHGKAVRQVPSVAEAVQQTTSACLAFVAQGLVPAAASWLEALVSLAAQPGVGLAGGYVMNRQQCYLHAGYAVDVPEGAVSHLLGACRWGACYQLLDRKLREVTGVSSTVCAVMRSTYLALGGYGCYASDLRGAVLGVKAMRTGLRNLITPHALMRCDGEPPCLTNRAPQDDLHRMAQEVGTHPAEHYLSPLLVNCGGVITTKEE